MAEAQATNQPESSATEQAIAAGTRVERKAKEFMDVLKDSSMKWASLGLDLSRKTLSQSARALECAASKIGEFERKFDKTPASEATTEADTPTQAPAAS